MSFFKRLAKLQSKVDYNGRMLEINVYDDEVSSSSPIMWLRGEVAALEDLEHLDDDEINNIVENEGYEETDEILYVEIIDFDDSTFYKLPEKRQNMASVVLLKNFLKFYKENFGKDSGYWMPVAADFANYELQEKFKAEVDKGTFPEVSKVLLGETSEINWNWSYYNKENRDLGQELLNQLIDKLKDKGVTFNSNNLVENFSWNRFRELYNQELTIMLEDNELLDSFYSSMINVTIENGNVIYNLPLKNSNLQGTLYFTTNIERSNVSRYINSEDSFIQNLLSAEQNLKIVFESVDIVSIRNNTPMTIEDVINEAKETAGILQTASIKRLKKKV